MPRWTDCQLQSNSGLRIAAYHLNHHFTTPPTCLTKKSIFIGHERLQSLEINCTIHKKVYGDFIVSYDKNHTVDRTSYSPM